jgi:hypothetical protein
VQAAYLGELPAAVFPALGVPLAVLNNDLHPDSDQLRDAVDAAIGSSLEPLHPVHAPGRPGLIVQKESYRFLDIQTGLIIHWAAL